MSAYFGTEGQQRLQAQAEAAVDFVRDTPGACQVARTMGCDQPDRLGWDQIDAFLKRDGVCSFRLIPAGEVPSLRTALADRDYRLDTWDVFVADRGNALAAAEAILAKPLPNGLAALEMPTAPDGANIRKVQALMARAGIVPFSGRFLAGALGPAKTVALGDQDGAVVAAAHGYFPHNRHSVFNGYAWGGLVAVDEAYRGKGLGAAVNALMILRMCRELGATHIYELVSTSNVPSRRMVEACGLRHEPSLVCGMAMREQSGRFTR